MKYEFEKQNIDNQPETVIEKGSLEDLQEIVQFNYEIFDGMYEDGPYSLAQYQAKLRAKEPVIFVAKKADKIAGDSIAFERDGSFYIWVLGVGKNYRGQGIGSSLLDKNEQLARENGYNKVSAKVYNVSPGMQRLIKQRGYSVVSVEESKTDPKYTALRFELKL